MINRVIVFAIVFICVVICSLLVAFCGGLTFGTSDFGWLIGGGMIVGAVMALMAAALPTKW